LRGLSAALLADLKVLNPLNAVGGYYINLTGCTVAFADGSVTGNCDATSSIGTQMQRYGLSGFTSIFWPVVMLLQTVLEIWYQSGWMGRVIYLLTLPLGMYAASETVDRIGDNPDEEWSVIGWVIFAALIPLFAGFAALALQWLLIVILWLFGKALAAIVWLMTVAAAPFAYASHTLGIVKEAKELEEGHATLSGDAKE
jgi:small-conductance mechanosensitive channel